MPLVCCFMTPTAPTPDNAEGRIGQPLSDAAVRRLAEAVAHLANDSDYFLQVLTDVLTAMRSISRERLTDNEVRFLIESGGFTAEAWAETSASVDRGYLQRGETPGWLLDLFATMSLENVSGFLGWDEKAVQTAVTDARLYAVNVSGRLLAKAETSTPSLTSWKVRIGADRLGPVPDGVPWDPFVSKRRNQ